MRMTVPYRYKLEYYPSNRHRKVREVILQDKTQIEIREINKEEFLLAANYYKKNWSGDKVTKKPLYYFENQLYREIKNIKEVFEERAKLPEWSAKQNKKDYDNFIEQFGAITIFNNHAEEAIEKIRDYANQVVHVGKKFYIPMETEPIFRYGYYGDSTIVHKEYDNHFNNVKLNAADIDWNKIDKEKSREWMEIMIPEAFHYGRDMEKIDEAIRLLTEEIWDRLFINVSVNFFPKKALQGILPAVIERVKSTNEQPYMFDEYTIRDIMAIILDERLGG